MTGLFQSSSSMAYSPTVVNEITSTSQITTSTDDLDASTSIGYLQPDVTLYTTSRIPCNRTPTANAPLSTSSDAPDQHVPSSTYLTLGEEDKARMIYTTIRVTKTKTRTITLQYVSRDVTRNILTSITSILAQDTTLLTMTTETASG